MDLCSTWYKHSNYRTNDNTNASCIITIAGGLIMKLENWDGDIISIRMFDKHYI